jgi:hypothetical protein
VKAAPRAKKIAARVPKLPVETAVIPVQVVSEPAPATE